MSVTVRPAAPSDLKDLVDLRLENGRVHAALGPAVYRVPEPAAVGAHVTAELSAGHNDRVLLVAVVDYEVLGLAEVSLDAELSAHQVLQPMTGAHVHLVVAEHARGRGLGRLLESAASGWAAQRGVPQLVAGIQSDADGGYHEPAVIRI